eukprot:COSAG02_NODE_1576_length_11868_cov_82.967117_2_plen_289_part_00
MLLVCCRKMYSCCIVNVFTGPAGIHSAAICSVRRLNLVVSIAVAAHSVLMQISLVIIGAEPDFLLTLVLSAEQLLHVRLASVAPFDMLVLDEVRSLCDKFKRQSTLSSSESVHQLQRVYETAHFVIAAEWSSGKFHPICALEKKTVGLPEIFLPNCKPLSITLCLFRTDGVRTTQSLHDTVLKRYRVASPPVPQLDTQGPNRKARCVANHPCFVETKRARGGRRRRPPGARRRRRATARGAEAKRTKRTVPDLKRRRARPSNDPPRSRDRPRRIDGDSGSSQRAAGNV